MGLILGICAAERVLSHPFSLSFDVINKDTNVHFRLVLKAVALYTTLGNDNFAPTNPIMRGSFFLLLWSVAEVLM